MFGNYKELRYICSTQLNKHNIMSNNGLISPYYSNPFKSYDGRDYSFLEFNAGNHLFLVSFVENFEKSGGCYNILKHLVFAKDKNHVLQLLKVGCETRINDFKKRFKDKCKYYDKRCSLKSAMKEANPHCWRQLLYFIKHGKFKNNNFSLYVEQFEKPNHFFKIE